MNFPLWVLHHNVHLTTQRHLQSFPIDSSEVSFGIFQFVLPFKCFLSSAFPRSLTSTAGSFPLPLPQAKSLLSGVVSSGGWLWSPAPGGKVQAPQGPCYPARGHGDGAGLATAEPGCPVPLAASQNFAFSYNNQMDGMKGTTGYTASGKWRRKQEWRKKISAHWEVNVLW